MRNVKLVIAYDGTSFSGWQRQKNVPTIQGTLEESIGRMTGGQVLLHGAGRTDAGVHALGMVANFNTSSTIPCSGFLKGLNSILPASIRITEASDVALEFHSRFNAVGKTYVYHFKTTPVLLPTERLYFAHLPSADFDYTEISACLEILEGEHDFSSFEASGSRDLTRKGGIGAVRTIFSAKLSKWDLSPNNFSVEIRGNGFLRHMVRNIVGTLFEVGIGKRTLGNFEEVLRGCDRTLAGATAPPNGLFLKEVFY